MKDLFCCINSLQLGDVDVNETKELNEKAQFFLQTKKKIAWNLYAMAIFPLIMYVCFALGLQVGSKPKERSLRDLSKQSLSRPNMSVFESVPKILKPDLPSQSKQSKNSYLVVSETIREVTAYNAGDPSQTSGDPCESANGENICAVLNAGHKRCAANFVPLGTMIKIDKFGVCKVTDRMNRRYKNRVDIAMRKHEKKKALKFGLQKLHVKILKRNT